MARELDLRCRAKDVRQRLFAWERQVSLPLVVNGTKVGTHRVDFKLYHHDGSHEFLEVKGFPTPVYRLKKRLVEALYPDIRYTVIS